METNEIMVNEEVIEAVEDVVPEVYEEITQSSGASALKNIAIGGAAVGGAILLYKKLIKPAIAKFKAKRSEGESQTEECVENNDDVRSDAKETVDVE